MRPKPQLSLLDKGPRQAPGEVHLQDIAAVRRSDHGIVTRC